MSGRRRPTASGRQAAVWIIAPMTDRPAVQRVSLDLPMPPSVNHIYGKNRHRVYLSHKYRMWRAEAGWELNIQKPGRIEGPYKLTVELARTDNRLRDADNYVKAASDLIVAHGIVADDSLAVSTTATWSNHVKACRVTLEAAP